MKNQNLNFERARNIIKGLLVLAAILCVVALVAGEGQFMAYATVVAAVLIVLAVFVMAVGMKCPYCGRAIIRKCLVVKSCPHCGRDLASGLKSKKKKR